MSAPNSGHACSSSTKGCQSRRLYLENRPSLPCRMAAVWNEQFPANGADGQTAVQQHAFMLCDLTFHRHGNSASSEGRSLKYPVIMSWSPNCQSRGLLSCEGQRWRYSLNEDLRHRVIFHSVTPELRPVAPENGTGPLRLALTPW
jgi:hypothetical protein